MYCAASLVGRQVLPDEVQQVRDGLERIVDLVRDDRGHAAGEGQLFRHAKGRLALAAVRQINQRADPSGAVPTLAAERHGTHQVPSRNAVRAAQHADLFFDELAGGD